MNNLSRTACGFFLLGLGLVFCPAFAVEIPGGTKAQIVAEPDSGFIRVLNNRQEYALSIEALIGILPKGEDKGCTLLIQADKGVQAVDVASSLREIMQAIRDSRAIIRTKPAN